MEFCADFMLPAQLSLNLLGVHQPPGPRASCTAVACTVSETMRSRPSGVLGAKVKELLIQDVCRRYSYTGYVRDSFLVSPLTSFPLFVAKGRTESSHPNYCREGWYAFRKKLSVFLESPSSQWVGGSFKNNAQSTLLCKIEKQSHLLTLGSSWIGVNTPTLEQHVFELHGSTYGQTFVHK